jgi:hypothetical protein
VLFFNPVQGGFTRRGSGRSHTGEITLWGRRSIRGWHPWWGTTPLGVVPHVSRVWSSREGVRVGPGGLAWRTCGVNPPRSGWVVTTSGPLPPGSPPGWSTLLKWVPVGVLVGGLAWAVHSPGSFAKILRHRAGSTQVRLPSGKPTWLPSTTGVTLGGNVETLSRPPRWFTAGDAWRKGWRPRVRGTAMNPVDHPHGGGQGKTSGGRPGVTPWGRLTRGVKTRHSR